MSEINALLLDVWREACRHIEIEQSVETIAGLLARRVPAAELSVWEVGRERGVLEHRASGPATSPPRQRVRPIGNAMRGQLLDWTRRGGLVRRGDRSALASMLEELLPPGEWDDWCAGPLSTEHDTAGVCLVRAAPGRNLDDDHLSTVSLLLEPLSAALENDRRLNELKALREAAEADKRSALSRLGRENLVDAIVGADAGLSAVMERVALVASSDVPVLILGET
ncbi:MAG TPA: hypothetical protein VNZ57_05665, partial [Longimicrobiales bacterium]|nr:hypothetical protein [Longimicrobiales bacterium]